MRTLFLLVGLYVVHRLLLQASPTYRARMRRLDRQIVWINIILVAYLTASFILRIWHYLAIEE